MERLADGHGPFEVVYEALLAHRTDGVLLGRPDGSVLRANAAACRMLRRTEDEIRRVGRAGLVVPDPLVAEIVSERDRSGAARGRIQFRLPDGSRFPAEISSAIGASPGGAVTLIIFRDVSERQRIEAELRASERRLRLFVEHAPAAIAMLDRDMRYLAVSRRWLQDYRLGDVDVVGRSHYEIFPDIPDRWKEIHRRCLAGAVEACDEDPFPRLDGSTDWVRWEIRPWRDDAGAIGGILLFSEVITARKVADLALRASEARLRTVVDSLAEGLAICDLDGRFVYWNRTALDMHGVAGCAVPDHLPIEAFERVFELSDDAGVLPPGRWPVRRILGGEVLRGVELTVRNLRGQWDAPRVYEYGGSLLHDTEGRPTAAVVTVVDVTARRRAEEAVSRNARRFESLVDKSNDLTLAFDAAGVITYASAATARVLGLPLSRVIGSSFCDYLPEEEVPEVRARIAAFAEQQGSAGHRVYRLRSAGGAWRTVELSARNLIGDPAIGGIVVNGRDVTEERRLEEQVQQAQRLESIGQLAGGVAHDFNNLLTVILSCGEALREGLRAGAPVAAEDVEEIVAAGERARDLTRQLLAFARKQVVAPVPLDLNAVVRGSEKLLRRVLGEDVEIAVRLEPALWPARCDPGQLDQVILNLAVNARDAMPSGGRLVIETANLLESGDAAGQERLAPPGEWVRLSIADSGGGMTDDVKRHLFEPFFTTKAPGRGTGLGLATVYGIVRQHGGFVRVESEPGRGARFDVLLPRTSEPAAATHHVRGPARARGAEHVLLVEDDPQVREVTARCLAGAGYTVLAARDGDEALALAARPGQRVDLLLTDVVLPRIGGRQVAESVLCRQPHARVLFISGYMEADDRRGMADPGTSFLPKPFTPSALLESMRAVLDRPAGATQG